MTNLKKAELIRKQLIEDGYVALKACECIDAETYRYILVKNFKEAEGPPCYLVDYHLIYSNSFLYLIENYLSVSGGIEIISPKDPFALTLRNVNVSIREVEL